MYGSSWTKKKVWGFSDSQLTIEYDRLLSHLQRSGINVHNPMKRHGSRLGEPTVKRLKTDVSADTLKESADPLVADEGQVHSPSVLTQVDDSADASHATVVVDASSDAAPADTLGGPTTTAISPEVSISH